MQQFLPVSRALAHGMLHAMVFDLVPICIQVRATLAIQVVFAQVAEHARPVHLGAHVAFRDGAGIAGAQVHCGLLAAPHQPQHIGNHVIFVEPTQRVLDPLLLMARSLVGKLEPLLALLLGRQRRRIRICRLGLARFAPGFTHLLPVRAPVKHCYIKFIIYE